MGREKGGAVKDNSGSMRVNKRKRPDSRDPDRTGVVKVGGVEYWASGWLQKDRETGESYLSLSFKPKAPRAAAAFPAPSFDADGPLPQQPQGDEQAFFGGRA